jgi:uncharacterized protein involved in exopolysaccharide biosynthesis
VSPSPDAITFQDIVTGFRRRWRSAVMWGLLGAVAGAGLGLLRPRRYQARASFVPEQTRPRNLPTGLGALAAQFGLDVGGSVDRSPQFYRDLVLTNGLLTQMLDSGVLVRPGEVQSIREMYRSNRDTSRAGVDRTLQRLRRRLAADADPRTSVVTITVLAPTPVAAEGVAALLIREVQAFNVTTRQLQARQTRVFLETRVADAVQALHDAEEQLRHFYEQNRRLADSPQLLFEETRLKRQVDLRQELYTTLSKQLETTRIDEVNDTPTITVIDPPFASSRPDGPGIPTLIVVAFALALGARVGLLLLFDR